MWARLTMTAALPALFACTEAAAAPNTPKGDRPRIEVAFVLDATGSMGPYIDDARARIRSVAADLATGEPAPEVRYALVAYRDKGDDYVTRVTPFTTDISAMHGALTATSAEGGGDTPEAVLEAMRDGIHKLRWTPASDERVLRLMYVIGDAEPQHYPDSPKEDTLVPEALARGISIQSIICGQPGGDGKAFFERVAMRSEGRAVSLAETGASAPRGVAGRPAPAATVGGTIAGTTRTYAADALDVTFTRAAGRPVVVNELRAAPVAATGLLGPQLRHVADEATFSDLWRAHTSLLPEAAAKGMTPPVVDFSRQHVLAAGGADLGLVLTALKLDEGRGLRLASVRPTTPGVRFYVIPAGPEPVVTVGE